MPTKDQHDELNVMVGNKMRALRRARKWSQEKLGENLGVTFQQVQKYEQGVNQLSAGQMLRVCQVFGVSPSELLGWESGNENPVASEYDRIIAKHGHHFIELMLLLENVPSLTINNMVEFFKNLPATAPHEDITDAASPSKGRRARHIPGDRTGTEVLRQVS